MSDTNTKVDQRPAGTVTIEWKLRLWCRICGKLDASRAEFTNLLPGAPTAAPIPAYFRENLHEILKDFLGGVCSKCLQVEQMPDMITETEKQRAEPGEVVYHPDGGVTVGAKALRSTSMKVVRSDQSDAEKSQGNG